MSQEFVDPIVLEPERRRFRLRINSMMRRAGMGQVIGYETYMDIEFIGGYDIRVYYPVEMRHLLGAVESELRLNTNLSQLKISNIATYIHEHRDQIAEAMKEIKDISG